MGWVFRINQPVEWFWTLLRDCFKNWSPLFGVQTGLSWFCLMFSTLKLPCWDMTPTWVDPLPRDVRCGQNLTMNWFEHFPPGKRWGFSTSNSLIPWGIPRDTVHLGGWRPLVRNDRIQGVGMLLQVVLMNGGAIDRFHVQTYRIFHK